MESLKKEPLEKIFKLLSLTLLLIWLGVLPNRAAAATIDLNRVVHDRMAGISMELLVPPNTYADDDGFGYAQVDIEENTASSYANGSSAFGGGLGGIALYGRINGDLYTPCMVGGGGEVHEEYVLRITSDYGAAGPVEVVFDPNPYSDIDSLNMDGGTSIGASFLVFNSDPDPLFTWDWEYGIDGTGNHESATLWLEFDHDYLIVADLMHSSGGEGDAPFDYNYIASLTMTANETLVPLPAPIWLFASGLIGFFGIRRKLNR